MNAFVGLIKSLGLALNWYSVQITNNLTAFSPTLKAKESVSKFLLHCQRLSQSLFNLFCRLTSAPLILQCLQCKTTAEIWRSRLCYSIVCHSKVFKINGQITTWCCFTAFAALQRRRTQPEITKSWRTCFTWWKSPTVVSPCLLEDFWWYFCWPPLPHLLFLQVSAFHTQKEGIRCSSKKFLALFVASNDTKKNGNSFVGQAFTQKLLNGFGWYLRFCQVITWAF